MTEAATLDNPRAVIGGNKGPIEDAFKDINAELPARLAADCGDLVQRTVDLAENAKGVPSIIANEAQEALATDILSQMNKHTKVCDSRRLGINAEPRKAQDIINSFFKTKAIDPLEPESTRINRALTAFKREKAERERREREERERIAREEQEKRQREAAEAERKRAEAEAAARRAEAEAKAAEERRLKAIADAKAAEERRRQAEIAAREAERRAAEAKTKRAREEAERAAAKAKADAEAEARAKADAEAAAVRERENLQAAKTEKSLAKAELSDANREAKSSASLAKQADGDVRRAEKASDAKASELSGVRGDYGGQSSLRTTWVGYIVDRKKLDLDELRDFFSDDDLQKALNGFVKVHKGGRKLRGANFVEETKTVVR